MKLMIIYFALLLALVIACEQSDMDYSVSAANEQIGTGTGTGGSLARFTISGNYLYTVDESDLKAYDISNEKKPVLKSETFVDFGIETIYPYGEYLFLGSRFGVYIYSIHNPSNPVQVSLFSHVYSCDPVVVKGNYAYSTLNSEGPCGQGLNELDIIDISNKSNPTLVKAIQMESPLGLGVTDSLLFVCDNGIKVYSLDNPANPEFIKTITSITDPVDVIPLDTLLLVATKQGLLQYSISNNNELQYLSSLYTN